MTHAVQVIFALFAYAAIGGVTTGVYWVARLPEDSASRELSLPAGILWPFALPVAAVILGCRAVAGLWASLNAAVAVHRQWTEKEQVAVLSSLPDDVAEGFEQLRLAIRQHKADGWRDVSEEDMRDVLELLENVLETEGVY